MVMFACMIKLLLSAGDVLAHRQLVVDALDDNSARAHVVLRVHRGLPGPLTISTLHFTAKRLTLSVHRIHSVLMVCYLFPRAEATHIDVELVLVGGHSRVLERNGVLLSSFVSL